MLARCLTARTPQSRSEPDSKQKTETELTFCYIFSVFRSFRIVSVETETETGLYQSQLKV